MRCFITGAAGYIGSSLIQRLHNDGHEVTGLIHHHIPEIKDETINYITGDITKASTYQSVLDTTDVIVHCAAIVKDYGPRNLFEKINYNGTKTIADLAQKKHILRFIFLIEFLKIVFCLYFCLIICSLLG